MDAPTANDGIFYSSIRAASIIFECQIGVWEMMVGIAQTERFCIQ